MDATLKKRFENKHVLLGVTGSIAAYKACDVLRRLQQQGADVRVIMTQAAQQFVAPLTFETLSGYEVVTQLFPPNRIVKTRHISLAEWADCILICPATANIIGKIASGIADDFLTTAVMASRSPVVFAPAMDYQMIQNPIYLANCEALRKRGYRFIPSGEGDLASGAKGLGRLAETHRIVSGVKMALFGSERLKGVKVLVTAGPTREFLDPVRYITNPSSGKMGFVLAEEAAMRGAEVTLVSGPTNLESVNSVNLKWVETAHEMSEVVSREWEGTDVLIMAAAVADYSPAETSAQKIKKGASQWSLPLVRTEDILTLISKKKRGGILVGFALETEDGEARARQKLKDKGLDLICLNNPLEEGEGFGQDTNRLVLIPRDGDAETLPLMPKWEAAERILDRVEMLLKRVKKT